MPINHSERLANDRKTTEKQNVALIFGGRSPEHEVSIVTAHQVCAALAENHNVVPIYITKDGEWLTGDALRELAAFTEGSLPTAAEFDSVTVAFEGTSAGPDYVRGAFVVHPKRARWFRAPEKTVLPVDVVFPAIHGTHGEDGTLQGLLELMNLPYVGSGVVGSASGMDKIVMKAMLRENQLPIVPYVWWTQHQWQTDKARLVENVAATLGYPVFVKPAVSGSSIGVSAVKNSDELVTAVELASQYCHRILVEQAVQNPCEINCAVIGARQVTASVCEQPMTDAAFLTFDDKYIHETPTKASEANVEIDNVDFGLRRKDVKAPTHLSERHANDRKAMAGAERKIPAPISEELTLHVQGLAAQTFQVLDCAGVARIDFLMDADEHVYVNEINTIPGSFSFYLWEHDGVAFPQLVSQLIDVAFSVHAAKNSLTYSYETNLLSHAGASFASVKRREPTGRRGL